MAFLDKVVEEKREKIRLLKRTRPVNELCAKIADFKRRPFYEAFSRRFPEDIRIIAEIKLASPSAGSFNIKGPLHMLVEAYVRGGAYAISVITEERYFHGRPEILMDTRMRTDLPLLRKDFIVDPYEIYESKAMGADAVLLIAEVLERDVLIECMEVARMIDVDILLEVHSEMAYEKVAGLKGFLLGINNRDLRTLKVDRSRGLEVLNHIPDDLPVIIESGIEGKKDIISFMERGVSGFLIGTTLVRSSDPAGRLRELRGFDGN